MKNEACFKKIYQADLAAIVAIEHASHSNVDEDFETEVVSEHCWLEKDIKGVLAEGTTTGWVVMEGPVYVAYYLLDTEPDGWFIRRLVVHPDYRKADFGRTILWRIYQKMVRSHTRKTLRAYVRENDVETCRWMAHMLFKSKVIRGGWDDKMDAIEFSFVTTDSFDQESEACSTSEEEAA